MEKEELFFSKFKKSLGKKKYIYMDMDRSSPCLRLYVLDLRDKGLVAEGLHWSLL